MSWRSFLYRRLCRVVTCELNLPSGGALELGTKYDVASAADVIVHPFYWQLFHLLARPPASVVDCGAHCGHFTVVANVCIRTRFGQPAGHYTAIEPNPMLLPVIRRTIARAGIADRTTIVQGLLGCDGPSADLWVHPKNYLTSSFSPQPGARPHRVPCVTAGAVIPPGPIDVLKVDIEGGEFGLLRKEPDLFRRAALVFVEIHTAPAEQSRWFDDTLTQMGFHDAGPRVEHCGQQLAVLRRDSSNSGSKANM
jgi:FkbM family methyltransferase